MKKTILVVLLVLLAFTIWSVLAFGKAKKGEEAKQPVEIEKAVPGPAPEDFPEVVLPKAHPSRPTAEDFQTVLDKKGKTPEQMIELQTESVPVEFESRPAKAPFYCEVRNQVGGAYYKPAGDWNLYCWGQLGLATLLNLDNNYWEDCPYPLYPFEITELAVALYAADTATIVSSARIYDVDYSGDTYPNAQICTPGGPQIDPHPGAMLWIIVPLAEPCCVYDEFFVAWMFDNSDDFWDVENCEPVNTVAPLTLVFDGSGRTGQSYWGPYAEYTGEPYYGWFDVVPNGLWSGALRIEVLGYTADQNECPPPVETWYYKEGMPDFTQYYEGVPGPAFCGPTAGANSIWWFSCVEGAFEPSWGGCLEGDEIALINEIAVAAGTDPALGTNCDALEAAIIQVIYDHGGWWFYEQTSYAPDFWYLQKSLRASHDKVLLLGFWQEVEAGVFKRFGGHFVTLAGVDIYNLAFALSDPATPAGYDTYPVAWPSPSPGGIVWIPDYYVNWPDFQGQNAGPFPNDGTYDSGLPVYVEVEQSINVSPGPRFMDGEIESSHAYEVDNNYGGFAAPNFMVDFTQTGDYIEGGYYGSFIAGTGQADLNCSYGDYYPAESFVPLAPPVLDSFFVTGEAGDYKIYQLTLEFGHSFIPELFFTEYVFGFWVPEGGTIDCEFVFEHVLVAHNMGPTDIVGLQTGIINDYDIGENFCEVGIDPAHQSMWMWDNVDTMYIFGMTKKPANAADVAITGWGMDNNNRIYDGQYHDSLKIWMESGTWQVDNEGTFTDKSFLIADNAFDLPAYGIHIEKWLKWGYYAEGTVTGGPEGLTFFLYNVLHQEGFYRGDANKDGKLDISDVIYMVNYLFKSGPKPIEFTDQMDVNCDDKTDVSDVIYCINYLFKGGLAPVDKNRFFLESPFVDQAHKDAYEKRVPGLFGDADWKDLGK